VEIKVQSKSCDTAENSLVVHEQTGQESEATVRSTVCGLHHTAEMFFSRFLLFQTCIEISKEQGTYYYNGHRSVSNCSYVGFHFLTEGSYEEFRLL
jgi:hypothetical protein